ncbi:MAG: hypothetical protein JW821_12870 [Deltaproteobacteria bacterium]|nr:hypothetical protein [Deltaproteobacteria bacterium]
MIKREHIKQAIDALTERDPDIGYSLNEMLGMGVIDVPAEREASGEGDSLHFLFDGEKVRINKILYFNEGIVPIEQGLLIKYGELARKQDLRDGKSPVPYSEISREIHEAGLRFLVLHEIDYALARLGSRLREGAGGGISPVQGEDSRRLLEQIRQEGPSKEIIRGGKDTAVLYEGVLGEDTPARFVRFPLSMNSLMQVADINLEFFHVRFVLQCLLRDRISDLFACVVEQRVVGLVFLSFRHRLLRRDLEITYLATLGGGSGEGREITPSSLRGIGTFLVAGVWMLWKDTPLEIKRIYLDAEIGARRFYRSAGFEPLGFSSYVLRQPGGYLARAVLIMANRSGAPGKGVIREIEGLIERQVKALRKRWKGSGGDARRGIGIDFMKHCLGPEARPEFGRRALQCLVKYGSRIPESEELLQYAREQAPERVKACIDDATIACR